MFTNPAGLWSLYAKGQRRDQGGKLTREANYLTVLSRSFCGQSTQCYLGGEFIFHSWVEKWPNLIPEFHLEEMGGISRGTIKLIWRCKCKGVSFRQTACASLCDTFAQLSRRILFFFSPPCLSPHLFCSLSLYCVGVCQKPWQVEHQMKLTDCWHLHSKCAWIKCSRQGLLFYFSAEVWWIMKQP